MKYRTPGRSALELSEICLGSMMFGGPCEEEVAKKIIDSAWDKGVNFIDTADVYQSGKTEEVLGRLLKGKRKEWVIATKFGYSMGHMGFAERVRKNTDGLSRKWILETFHNSLRRLQSDYVDILYFHRSLPGRSFEEGLRTVGDLMAQGKLLYYGISNFRGWEIAEIVRLADQMGIARPLLAQPLYNITDRTAEMEILPACQNYGIGVVPYSPLARGILSGKYKIGEKPSEDSRVGRADKRMMETEWREESVVLAERLKEYAREKGCSLIAFAIAWVLANPNVTSIIAGPRTLEQWESYQEALQVKITPEDEVFIDHLVKPGLSSTAHYLDPAYPPQGRFKTF
ncbi:aldo/keto reductase [Acetobacteraceae bacterium]|nr:aldo/keto reductase [Acetobacteraceae bacterium]